MNHVYTLIDLVIYGYRKLTSFSLFSTCVKEHYFHSCILIFKRMNSLWFFSFLLFVTKSVLIVYFDNYAQTDHKISTSKLFLSKSIRVGHLLQCHTSENRKRDLIVNNNTNSIQVNAIQILETNEKENKNTKNNKNNKMLLFII